LSLINKVQQLVWTGMYQENCGEETVTIARKDGRTPGLSSLRKYAYDQGDPVGAPREPKYGMAHIRVVG
jgi:hypothetical protein